MTDADRPLPPETPAERPPRGQSHNGPFSRSLVLACLALGGFLALLAGAQPWWRASAEGAEVAFSGTEATGGLTQSLAVVTLAGTLLVLVLRARGRRLLGALLALAGLGLTVTGVSRVRPSAEAVRTKLRQVTLSDQVDLASTSWPWLFAVAGLAVLYGALGLLLRAHLWPTRLDRFDRGRTTAASPGALSTEDPTAIWKALDAGVDPTAPPQPADQPTPPRPPNVHIEESGDTMVANADRQPSARQQPGRDEPEPTAGARSAPTT